MRVRHRRGMHASGNQPGEVRHVHQVKRANLVGDLAHARKINDARVRAAAADNQLRPFALRQFSPFRRSRWFPSLW